MNNTSTNTAILFFSRTAAAESENKTIFSRQAKMVNKLLFQDFISDAYLAAKNTGLPVFWINEAEQVGNSFGSRIANAFDAVYKKGYNNVLAIGNDCPDLSTEGILKAAEALSNHKLVLGATQDGGSYLIGLQKVAFDKKRFSSLPWQTNELYTALQNSVNGSVFCAKYLLNVNDFSHLVLALSDKQIALYFQLLSDTDCASSFKENYKQKPFIPLGTLRGPPRY